MIKGEAMRRFSYFLVAGMMILTLVMLGCGRTNQYGGSFDIQRICADNTCSEVADNPEVSIFADTPLTVYMELNNNMESSGDYPGQTVRTRRVEIDYTPPPNSLPLSGIRRVEEIAANIEPDSMSIIPVTIVSYEQIEYIRDRLGQFPDLPFQVSCRITLFYDTTGGVTGSVERNLSIQVTQ